MPLKIDAIDYALHEIESMVAFALCAAESLLGSEHDKEKFEMPAHDANLLDFALFDVAKRIKTLREIIQEPGPEPAKKPAPVFLIRGGDECA